MTQIPLIIDTDVALGVHHEGRPRDIDDGFAIAEAINSPEIDLKLISTVYGNGPLEEVHRVAREIVALKHASVPVARGAEAFMTDETPDNDGVKAIARVLKETPCAVAAIGPLTNIGLLAKYHPEAFAQISMLLIVAGRTQGNLFMLGDTGPVRDFNFENDPLATRIALEAANDAGIEVVMAGFELTSQVCVTEEDLKAILARGSDTAKYFYENSLAWCRHWTGQFAADDGFHPWDSATISYLKHPEYFTTEQRGWQITEQDTGPPHLATGPGLPGKTIYCTGFSANGKRGFVLDVVESVH